MRIEIPGTSDQLACRLDLPAAGSDLVLLYCHGFASSQRGSKADYFRERALAAGAGFASFDFRGHGESGGGMFELTLDRNLEDLGLVHAALAARGFSRVALLGSSMGAGSAIAFAARFPEKVAAAVHVAPALEMDRGLLRLVGVEKAQRWEETGSVLFEHELGAYELSWRIIENLRGYDFARLAATYRTPTLMLQGMRDASVDWRAVADFCAAARQAEVELHLFANGDHRLLEQLPALWELTEIFLKGRGFLAS